VGKQGLLVLFEPGVFAFPVMTPAAAADLAIIVKNKHPGKKKTKTKKQKQLKEEMLLLMHMSVGNYN